MTFKTQKEILEALIAGKKITNTKGKFYCEMQDDLVVEIEAHKKSACRKLSMPTAAEEWSILEEPMVLWVNVYIDGLAPGFYISEDSANERRTSGSRTVKFVEVKE